MYKNVDGYTTDGVKWRQQEDRAGSTESKDAFVLIDNNKCLWKILKKYFHP